MNSKLEIFRTHLLKLQELLSVNKAGVVPFLKDGLSIEAVNAISIKSNLTFPEELKEMYVWKDGTEWAQVELGILWIFPGGMFFPLERSLEIYLARASKDQYWKDKMFPIFGSGGGEYFLIDLDTSSKSFGQIFFYSLNDLDFEGIISYFDSLTSAIDTINECLIEKVFYISKEGFLESNLDRERIISAKHNSKSNYWKLYSGGQTDNIDN